MHFMLKVKVLMMAFPSPMWALTAILVSRDSLLQSFQDTFFYSGSPYGNGMVA